LWVVEDLGWTGSISSAALALAASRRLRVSIGIAPAPLRNRSTRPWPVGEVARMAGFANPSNFAEQWETYLGEVAQR
jgi:AraC-like DNA-binding protein